MRQRGGDPIPPRRSFAHVLRADGIEPIQQKIYGTSWLEGSPIAGSGLAGVQVWGVKGASVTNVPGGRLISGEGFRLLHLSTITGRPRTCITDQASAMLNRAESHLAEHGMTFRHVVRTWIYLRRILDWYGEFNRVRTAFFKRVGLKVYPASTGIQGHIGDEECMMDLLAFDGTGSATPMNRSVRQNPATSYGSSFSRGMRLSLEGRDTLFISGTASIGPDGRTRHVCDVEGQVLETLLSVAALLQSAGAGLQDIASATLFCKTPQAFEAFTSITDLLGVPAFPVVPVLADVCRPDLEVELEAVAYRPDVHDLASPSSQSLAR
ncbi:MAG: RidA family protein [Candidatus Xenobia bacterium]